MVKNKKNIVGLLIGLGLLLTFLYLGMPKEAGILVSCYNHQIIDVRNMPPNLMQIAPMEICKVNVTVTNFNGNLICQSQEMVFELEKGIIKCKGLKKFKSNKVKIEAVFFDLNNSVIGLDVRDISINL